MDSLKTKYIMLNIKGLSKIYRTEEVETTALNNVNFTVNEGEFISVMGPSGCGKSTLLNIIGLLDSTESGSYTFGDKEIVNLNEKQRGLIRKENIGFIFQNFNLIDELTVFENVELPLVYNKVPKAERRSRVEKILSDLQIEHRRNHFPQQLSGGQQQRVAVARALVTKPKLILADEPTGNLDSKNGNEVMELLTDLHQKGATIIMVTHSSYDAGFSTRIVELKDGQIVAERVNKREISIV
ncbi:MAG: putative ABC transport system ATP-binding protein [Saprospiraceae bacterium]|jgi:putative ABC transport system ATP-binding protein